MYDRIIKINGRELRGPMIHSIGHSAALTLTIERPPKASSSPEAQRTG